MKVFYTGRRYRTKANGEYNVETGILTVQKGSIVSDQIACFRSTSKITKLRDEYVDENGVLLEDLSFTTPSSAASFVAGYSVDGYRAWHVQEHVTLKTALKK